MRLATSKQLPEKKTEATVCFGPHLVEVASYPIAD